MDKKPPAGPLGTPGAVCLFCAARGASQWRHAGAPVVGPRLHNLDTSMVSGSVAPQHVGVLALRPGIEHVSLAGRWNLSNCTAREVPYNLI